MTKLAKQPVGPQQRLQSAMSSGTSCSKQHKLNVVVKHQLVKYMLTTLENTLLFSVGKRDVRIVVQFSAKDFHNFQQKISMYL